MRRVCITLLHVTVCVRDCEACNIDNLMCDPDQCIHGHGVSTVMGSCNSKYSLTVHTRPVCPRSQCEHSDGLL